MNKRLFTMVAVIMAVLMATLTPIQTLAAPKNEYISEIRMSDSKDKLTELGYKVLDKDLNAGTEESFTYIGFKTTTDPDEAITDISIMDMKGGYSFSDYRTMLEQQREAVAQQTEIYRIAIDEFAERYNEGSKAALIAFESLNGFIEDDSGKLLGDMLIDPDLSDDDLIKITMQASMIVNATITNCLAIGLAQDGEGNWLSRISENEETAPDAFDDAMVLIGSLDSLRESMQEYLDMGLTVAEYETNPEAFAEFSSEDIVGFGERGMLYETLSQYKYKNGTVADLLISESIEPEDLYPLIAALTPGQLAIAQISGLQILIKAANVSDTIWDDAIEQAEDAMNEAYGDEGKEKVSVYIGVDRDIYNGGVALTSDAMRKSKSTGDTSWWYGNVNSNIEIAMIASAVSSVALFATFFLTWEFFAGKAMRLEAITAEQVVYFMNWRPGGFVFGGPTYATLLSRKAAAIAFAKKMVTVANIAMWVSGAILCVVIGLYVGLEVYNYYNPDYTEIPLVLMDLKFGESDEVGDWEKYIKYNVVLNEGGSAGDLNGFAAKQWNAMYVTKDRAAGKPILADSFAVQYGDSTTPRNYSPIHYFGSADAFNLNSHCYNDDVDGIFAFFRGDDKALASETASVFGNGTLAAVTGIGGLAVGALGTLLIPKKKSSEEK